MADFQTNTPSIGTLFVKSTDIYESTLDFKGTSSNSIANIQAILKDRAFVLMSKAGQEEDLTIHIADPALAGFIGKVIVDLQNAGRNRRTIVLGDEKTAQLSISSEQEFVVFDVLDPRITKHGYTRMPFRVKRNIVSNVIKGAAHFYWHLRRGTEEPTSDLTAVLEFTKLIKRKGRVQVDGKNLIKDGQIDLIASETVHGLKLVNTSKSGLYPYVLFFNVSDLSIGTWVLTRPILTNGDIGRCLL